MTYHIYDVNEYTQEIEIVSADYEREMFLSYSDLDQEEDFREYAEEAVKAKFGVNAILVWEGGNEMDKMWYAVQRTADDDWGWGSFDWDEAVEMLEAQGQGMIATINDENKVCEDVTYYEDIFC